MRNLDRMALVVFVREPLVDWMNEIEPEQPVWLEEIAGRGNVYLIPKFVSADDAEDYLENGFWDEIFVNELREWCEDESRWPVDRTFEMFLDWFDVLFDVAVFDGLQKDN